MDFNKPFNPTTVGFDFGVKPILLHHVKVDMETTPDDMAAGYKPFIDDLMERYRKIAVLHNLPKRLGRKGRKAMRAKMIRNGHFHRPDGTGNGVRWQKEPLML